MTPRTIAERFAVGAAIPYDRAGNLCAVDFTSRVTRSRGFKPRKRSSQVLSQALTVCIVLSLAGVAAPSANAATGVGLASWYGEEHRGKLMANGRRFDPDQFTAASWYYPLGTRVRVTLASGSSRPRSVLVTITDRGPAMEYVRDGRIIDLSHAPFKRLAPPNLGLVTVAVQVVR
jgi:rare lipoprotein A